MPETAKDELLDQFHDAIVRLSLAQACYPSAKNTRVTLITTNPELAMTDCIVSNSEPAVNREYLLNLNILLKKNAALARLLFECNIIEFEEEDPACQYLWTLVDNVMVAEEHLDAVLSGVPEVKSNFSQGAHKRLDRMLQVAEQMRQLMETPSCTETIHGLKRQLHTGGES